MLLLLHTSYGKQNPSSVLKTIMIQMKGLKAIDATPVDSFSFLLEAVHKWRRPHFFLAEMCHGSEMTIYCGVHNSNKKCHDFYLQRRFFKDVIDEHCALFSKHETSKKGLHNLSSIFGNNVHFDVLIARRRTTLSN